LCHDGLSLVTRSANGRPCAGRLFDGRIELSVIRFNPAAFGVDHLTRKSGKARIRVGRLQRLPGRQRW